MKYLLVCLAVVGLVGCAGGTNDALNTVQEQGIVEVSEASFQLTVNDGPTSFTVNDAEIVNSRVICSYNGASLQVRLQNSDTGQFSEMKIDAIDLSGIDPSGTETFTDTFTNVYDDIESNYTAEFLSCTHTVANDNSVITIASTCQKDDGASAQLDASCTLR